MIETHRKRDRERERGGRENNGRVGTRGVAQTHLCQGFACIIDFLHP